MRFSNQLRIRSTGPAMTLPLARRRLGEGGRYGKCDAFCTAPQHEQIYTAKSFADLAEPHMNVLDTSVIKDVAVRYETMLFVKSPRLHLGVERNRQMRGQRVCI